MPQTTGVAEAILYVRQLDDSAEFFNKVCGFTLTASFPDARFLQCGRDSTLILFSLPSLRERVSVIPAHGAVGPSHVAFGIDSADYDTWLARLMTNEVAVEHEQVWSSGAKSIYFRDLDNNSIEFIENQHYPSIWERISG